MKRPQGVHGHLDAGEAAVKRQAPTKVPQPSAGPSSREAETQPVAVVAPFRSPKASPADEVAVEGEPEPGSGRWALARAARRRRRYERGEVRRFTKRSRHRRTVLLTIVGALLLLVLAVAVAAYSPLMSVRTIEVDGASRVDADDIRSALASEMGVPLTLVDRAEVGDALADFPLIQSYAVEASPPDTLLVRIIERTPVGVLENAGVFTLVDAAGVTIESGAAAPAGYPVITTPSGNWTGDAFAAVATVVRSLPGDLDGQVAAASATTANDVTLTLVSGATVVWGSADDSALKAVVLDDLMTATDPAGVAQYNVSSPSSAVVLPQ
ncbi:FtsQ-type POTRA domain-containing protein [Microbacteriaceae bacterium VKM Ac-2855]|nr:FtsQ-type POTRA domain-containing protein [Microbacteriaceae bacterium VKM Ac-2855]